MRASRRTVLKGSALIAAAPVVGGMANTNSRLVVFDRELPESLAFAAGKIGPRLDLADAHANRWAALRRARPEITSVDGLSGWSDWVGLRGELEGQGFRLRTEQRVSSPASGKTHLFRWSMRRG